MAIAPGAMGEAARYTLRVGDERLELNACLGRPLALAWTGAIACTHCGRATKKSFAQGHCYPCFKTLAQCDTCIMKPETCHFFAGTCREPEWAERHCFQPHIVYLANASGLKVGITRGTQVPTRWLDQGAVQALPIFSVDTRQQSGFVEMLFKEEVSDRTNWRAMLKGDTVEMDLPAERDRLLARLEGPTKVVSHNLDKTPEIAGTLLGLKGQYLILDSGVINLRKYTGYEVRVAA
ncbi:MAG: DUF2797 domain-containing protein [Halomonas sp.]|nr:DUF2797 domain-containing protein [Halomonas sp.]